MGNTNVIYYEKVNNEVKLKILEEFKKTYSDKNIKEISVFHKDYGSYQIDLNKYRICFQYEPNLIDFICELNRPFVFSDLHAHGYDIRFVYGLK
jgi:hypothetical protein